jgi:protein-L-isoaspartate(D-aspartate) O-methyltransferase
MYPTMATVAPDRRRAMIEDQLRARGIRDGRVLAAMGVVRREDFVPAELAPDAYADRPLPIGQGQTISQPYIVGLMTQALGIAPGDRVLEIGTGSGYGAAVLARLAREVYTIERRPELAQRAHDRLRSLGYHNVHVCSGDGTLGWPEARPFDAISVTAGSPTVPGALVDQLAIGGRLVIPVGREDVQRLIRVTRTSAHQCTLLDLGPVQFVPLIGAAGWSSAARS